MNIDAIAALGGAYWHALIAVATVRKQPFIYDSYQMIWTVCKSFAIEVVATSVFFYIRHQQRLRESEKIMPELLSEPVELVVKRRMQMLHLLVTRLAATSEFVTEKELQKLILSSGHSPDHADSIFVLRELICSPAVDASKGCVKFAANPSLQRDICSSAFPASQTWQSKEDLHVYLKEVIVSMADVTGTNEVSVAYALQSNLGSLVGALKDIVTSTEPWVLTPSAQQPESQVCPLMVSHECNATFVTCPSCGSVVCTACHMSSVLDTVRFTMLDDNPTRARFEHEGLHQSLAFFCCVNSACGALLPPRIWNAFKTDVASPRSKKLPDTLLSHCARLVSRVCRHSARPLIVSCVCSKFYWRSSPFLPAICECGKSSLEHLSVQEDQKWAREMEQYLVDKKNAPAASHQGVEPSAAYKAFAKAGCSKEFLREYARVQESLKTKVETLADGRQISLDFDHLPQLNENARIFIENGSTFSLSQSSKHGVYPVITLSTACRDALRFNESGPLAMIESGTLKFIANRMCPKCYCGPMAESECGSMQTHQGQHIAKGQQDSILGHRAIQAHIIDNSCRRCKFLGQNVLEYPLYDPVVAENCSKRAERDTAVVSVSEGFDECISKLPAIVRTLSELRLKREKCDSLCISSLPPESLESMLRCARAAVIRHHLSTLTPNQSGDSSFGLILWRAIKCSEKTSGAFSKSWLDIRHKWIRSCFGSDRIPSLTLLESATFFAAAVAPLVMQEFSSRECVLFANGSFESIPGVEDRLIKASQIPWQIPIQEIALGASLFEIAFGFVIFTAYAIVAYWPSRLLTMLLDPFMIRILYSVMLSWIFIGAFNSNLSIVWYEQFQGSNRHAQFHPIILMLLKFLGCGLSLACVIYLVQDFAFSVPMLLLAHSPLWFCAQYCVPLVAHSARSGAKIFFPNLLENWIQQRSIRRTLAECLQTLFVLPVYLLKIIKTCKSYIFPNIPRFRSLQAHFVYHFGLLCLCLFVDRITLEPGVLEQTPDWMQIVKALQCVWYFELVVVLTLLWFCSYTKEHEDSGKEDRRLSYFEMVVVLFLLIFLQHFFLVPVRAGLSSPKSILGEVYVGSYRDHHGTEHETFTPFFFFIADRFNVTRSGIGNQSWYNGDVYCGEWRDNNMNGKGKYFWSNCDNGCPLYQGDWIDGKRSGYGIQMWRDGEVYQGQWNNHKRNGKGKLTFPNVAVYEGEFVDDNYHGLGTISFSDGRVFKGEFRNGVYSEQGNVTLPNISPQTFFESSSTVQRFKKIGALLFEALFLPVYILMAISWCYRATWYHDDDPNFMAGFFVVGLPGYCLWIWFSSGYVHCPRDFSQNIL